MSQTIQDSLYARVAEVMAAARSQVRSVVNQAMVLTYWVFLYSISKSGRTASRIELDALSVVAKS
jgi:hypothetical protein